MANSGSFRSILKVLGPRNVGAVLEMVPLRGEEIQATPRNQGVGISDILFLYETDMT